MKIDIDELTEPDLIDLNNRIVARLRFLRQARAYSAMLELDIGDRVEFEPDAHRRVIGVLTRHNKKTVTVLADTGERWNVSPHLVRVVKNESHSHRSGPKGLRLIQR